jgi:hypothetical protein
VERHSARTEVVPTGQRRCGAASDGLRRSDAATAQAQGDNGDGLGREKTVCGTGAGRE